jgi:serine/threonine-protein kinase
VALPFTGLTHPVAVSVDTQGGVYVSDTGNNRVVKLAADSYTQTVVPFTGLNNLQEVAIGREGLVFVSAGDSTRVMWPQAQTKTAAPPWQAVSTTEWTGPFTDVKAPLGVFSDDYPNFWVSDSGNNRVLKYTSQTNAPQVVPFTGLNKPDGVTCGPSCQASYVVDTGNNRVLQLTGTNNTQTVLAFTGLNNPHGVAATYSVVYVTDGGNNRVVKLTTDSSTKTTTEGVLPFAGLNNPTGIALDVKGDLYVVDSGNNRVLKLTKDFLGQ